MSDDPCPCGSGAPVHDCCGPLLSTERLATTAEELMRSRYTAHVFGNVQHLWRTWDARTRPMVVNPGDTRWTGLKIVETVDGGPEDQTGIVDFIATHEGGQHAERAEFSRRGGRWFYTRGDA